MGWWSRGGRLRVWEASPSIPKSCHISRCYDWLYQQLFLQSQTATFASHNKAAESDTTTHLFIYLFFMSWRDSKSTDYSSRWAEVDSQHPHGCSPPSVNPVPGALMHSSDLHRHQAYTQAKHSHIKNNHFSLITLGSLSMPFLGFY